MMKHSFSFSLVKSLQDQREEVSNIALSKECKEFCKLLAERYNSKSEMVTIDPLKYQINPKVIQSFFDELKANKICNPSSNNCFLSSDIAYFNLTKEGKDYLSNLKN